ncbi:MAG: FAD/NAD(P)-binding protein [Cyanobacteria bacterium SZAS-4]|nr:FAD/NAD(P)-binding protein [Cyanobacteria bacterium SZAS-4]
MPSSVRSRRIAIVGGGPSALMLLQQLVSAKAKEFELEIFEASDAPGRGMPYSSKGADHMLLTNVSADELPRLSIPLDKWIKALPKGTLKEFGIERKSFNKKKPIPRLLFGHYLQSQFEDLLEKANDVGLKTHLHLRAHVIDVKNNKKKVVVVTSDRKSRMFDYVIISVGHHWPLEREGKVPHYFDSPYPPAKLAKRFNGPIAIRGSSLTAVDAVSTLMRSNGVLEKKGSKLKFRVNEKSSEFRIVMYSKDGLLPCVRIHMEEPHTAAKPVIAQAAIDKNIIANDGFLELDFLFKNGFKEPLRKSAPKFYKQIEKLNLEMFVEKMMSQREGKDPFELLHNEYEESQKSIKKKQPIYWKEMLAALSFAMNYPAKHLSAEDMLRLQNSLSSLIAVVIAFMPQRSCQELLALHEAGRLELIADSGTGQVKAWKRQGKSKLRYSYKDEAGKVHAADYLAFVNCTGQVRLEVDDFPFRSLVEDGTVSAAKMAFRDEKKGKAEKMRTKNKDIKKSADHYYLQVAGANISDYFQLVDKKNEPSHQIYLMAVPYMGGFNPDYSGLDFCERASKIIVEHILNDRS